MTAVGAGPDLLLVCGPAALLLLLWLSVPVPLWPFMAVTGGGAVVVVVVVTGDALLLDAGAVSLALCLTVIAGTTAALRSAVPLAKLLLPVVDAFTRLDAVIDLLTPFVGAAVVSSGDAATTAEEELQTREENRSLSKCAPIASPSSVIILT